MQRPSLDRLNLGEHQDEKPSRSGAKRLRQVGDLGSPWHRKRNELSRTTCKVKQRELKLAPAGHCTALTCSTGPALYHSRGTTWIMLSSKWGAN